MDRGVFRVSAARAMNRDEAAFFTRSSRRKVSPLQYSVTAVTNALGLTIRVVLHYLKGSGISSFYVVYNDIVHNPQPESGERVKID